MITRNASNVSKACHERGMRCSRRILVRCTVLLTAKRTQVRLNRGHQREVADRPLSLRVFREI